MADLEPTPPVAKPTNMHATGEDIVSKNMHATDAPLADRYGPGGAAVPGRALRGVPREPGAAGQDGHHAEPTGP